MKNQRKRKTLSLVAVIFIALFAVMVGVLSAGCDRDVFGLYDYVYYDGYYTPSYQYEIVGVSEVYGPNYIDDPYYDPHYEQVVYVDDGYSCYHNPFCKGQQRKK